MLENKTLSEEQMENVTGGFVNDAPKLVGEVNKYSLVVGSNYYFCKAERDRDSSCPVNPVDFTVYYARVEATFEKSKCGSSTTRTHRVTILPTSPDGNVGETLEISGDEFTAYNSMLSE